MQNQLNLTQYVPLNLIDSRLLPDIQQAISIHTAEKGKLIFKRGRELSSYFYLVEGEVDLIGRDFNVEKVVTGSERACRYLNLQSPTTVSAIAKSHVTYFCIDRRLVEKAVSTVYQEDEASSGSSGDELVEDFGMEVGEIQDECDWMSSILQSPLFSKIPLTRLQELFGRFETVYARKGERIVKEGATGDYFYVLASGSASVVNRSGSVSVSLKAGNYFGEEALISRAPRNATVTMTSDGMLKQLNYDDFNALVKEPVLQYVTKEELWQRSHHTKVIDVRLPIEYRACHFPGSINIPLSRLRDNVAELGKGCLYAIAGEAEVRADLAAYILCQAGFEVVILKPEHKHSESLSNVS